MKEIHSIDDELQQFADFLMTRAVSEETARKILITEARGKMIAASQTSVDKLFDSLRTGDLPFFIEFINAQMPMQDTILYAGYEMTIKRWVEDASVNRLSMVSLSDIGMVYQYIIGAPTAPAKLKRMLNIHRLNYDAHVAGMPITWAFEATDLAAYHERKAARIASQQPPNLRAVQ